MELAKKIAVCFVLVLLMGGPVWADVQSNPNQGIFTSVTGKVEVHFLKSHKTKMALKDMTVFEGDKISTQNQASAVLRLFDGSTLTISPGTEFVLSKLEKPSAQDKVIQFKLIVGELLAAVEKLTTSKSSFEIEAGGVVCGVRGTKFSMRSKGGNKPQIELHVFEGIVYAIDTKGNKLFFRPGPPVRFVNGTPSNAPNSGAPPPNNTNASLNDLNQQFNSNVQVNQSLNLNSIQGGNVVTVKPSVGN
jgi:hypothetical protein